MDWDRVSGLWTEYQGIAKANWGRLTENDMTAISGSRDLLIGKLQTRYGLTKDQAEQQVDNWVATLAVQAAKPLAQAADYMSGPANYAASALTDAANRSIQSSRHSGRSVDCPRSAPSTNRYMITEVAPQFRTVG
jgi:uncharacterized protein YjbJ (UPF0337 family)